MRRGGEAAGGRRRPTRAAVALALLSALLPARAASEEALRFADRSAGSGLELVTYSGSVEKPHILESTGNGVLVLDYDGDGYQDLYFVAAYRLPRDERREEERSALYRNNGDGTFSDVTERAGVGARVYGHGGCVGDVDGDGLPDIYLTAYGRNILYRNNGDGTFSDVTERAGVAEPRWSIGATFLDADADGDQDLFVSNYIDAGWEEILSARRTRRWRGKVEVMDGPRGLVESLNAFYRNRGDGTFEEATGSSGLEVGGYGYSMGVASFDYDYDGDGWLDLAVTNFANDYYALYRNLSGAAFQDQSFVAGLAVPSFAPLGWGVLFFDADNDRDLDLFFSNGHIYPQVDEEPSLRESYRQPNQLLVNEGGHYREVSAEAGDAFDLIESSRGAVYFDLENDGDLDLAISNQDAAPNLLENVSATSHHWLQVDLRPRSGPRQALGARVTVEVGGERQIREIASGGSYASELDGRPHFGLGPAAAVDRLTLRWPDGRRSAFVGLAADRFYLLWRRGDESGER